MRNNKFIFDRIIKIIVETELPASSVASVARKYGVNANTISKWKKKYKGLNSSEARTLKMKILN